MPRVRKLSEPMREEALRPALTPEARENQLISLAIDLAEKQLREGTASSQVISHYLKLGSTKDRLEKEIMEAQRDLYTAKTKAIHTMDEYSAKFDEAIQAMMVYQGVDQEYDDPDL